MRAQIALIARLEVGHRAVFGALAGRAYRIIGETLGTDARLECVPVRGRYPGGKADALKAGKGARQIEVGDIGLPLVAVNRAGGLDETRAATQHLGVGPHAALDRQRDFAGANLETRALPIEFRGFLPAPQGEGNRQPKREQQPRLPRDARAQGAAGIRTCDVCGIHLAPSPKTGSDAADRLQELLNKSSRPVSNGCCAVDSSRFAILPPHDNPIPRTRRKRVSFLCAPHRPGRSVISAAGNTGDRRLLVPACHHTCCARCCRRDTAATATGRVPAGPAVPRAGNRRASATGGGSSRPPRSGRLV